MSHHDALRFTEGVMDRLRATYADKSPEELLDLVCQLTKTYVLDQTIPYDLPLPERAVHETDRPDAPAAPDESQDEDAAEPSHARFARLIEGLKRRTGLPQLAGFERASDGRMILTVDNQKVTFGERVTVEFVPRNSPRPSSVGRLDDDGDDAPAPLPAPAPRPAAAPGAPRPAAAPGAPSGARSPAPGATPAPARPQPQPQPAPEPQPAPSEDSNLDDVDHVVERFRGLELD